MQQQESLSEQQRQQLHELQRRVANEQPLPDENYSQDLQILQRFLQARNWKIDAAEKQLREAIAWRRSYKPLRADCNWCHSSPGYHSLRQVGFDTAGRPVIYSCFAQADASKYNVEDSIAHCTYLIENAKRSVCNRANTWSFVIDCTGISLSYCNPSLSSGLASVFSDFYPEHMERIVVVNHSSLFHGLWSAISVFMEPNTLKKIKFVRGKEKLQRKLRQIFGDEMGNWLLEEVRLNKQEPMPLSQEKFWEAPMRPGQHDPRGCSSYVEEFVDPYFLRATQQQQHKPHPSIADQQLGQLRAYVPRAQRKEQKKRSKSDDAKEVRAEMQACGIAAGDAADFPDIECDSDEAAAK